MVWDSIFIYTVEKLCSDFTINPFTSQKLVIHYIYLIFLNETLLIKQHTMIWNSLEKHERPKINACL